MQNDLKNTHTKFGSDWCSSLKGEIFLKDKTSKIGKKRLKRAKTPTWLNRLKCKLDQRQIASC